MGGCHVGLQQFADVQVADFGDVIRQKDVGGFYVAVEDFGVVEGFQAWS